MLPITGIRHYSEDPVMFPRRLFDLLPRLIRIVRPNGQRHFCRVLTKIFLINDTLLIHEVASVVNEVPTLLFCMVFSPPFPIQ